MTTVKKKGDYVLWDRTMTWLDSKVRAQKRVLPSNMSTCWEVNTKAGILSIPSTEVSSCAACFLFLGDKALYSHLQKHSSNKEAPYRYRCESPWRGEGGSPSPAKRTAFADVTGLPSPAKCTAVVDVTPPNKKKCSSPSESPLRKPANSLM
jgi:hypothetical protein